MEARDEKERYEAGVIPRESLIALGILALQLTDTDK